MAEPSKRGNFLQFVLLFLTLYIGVQLVYGLWFPSQPAVRPVAGPRIAVSSSFTLGNHPVIQITNVPETEQSFGMSGWVQSKWCSITRFFGSAKSAHDCAMLSAIYSGKPYTLPDRCPSPSLDLFTVQNPGDASEKLTPMTSKDTVVPCETTTPIQPGETVSVSLAPWKYSLFEKTGMTEVRLPGTPGATKDASGALIVPPTSARFVIVEPGVFTKIFRTFISAPFLNFLVFIASFSPNHSLGIAIIVLTLAVKILLFFPTQHALEGQKKMQMLQPKLEALKAKHKGDQKKIQEETMKLWHEHKINPFQSCLPLLIQFPVLIGLLYVIRDQSNIELTRHLIYSMYQNLPWHFGTNFLGLNLLKPDVYVMPVLLFVLQFFQMKLSFSIQKRKKKKQDVIDVPAKNEDSAVASAQDMQQKMMVYGLPLMIAYFAFTFPSAVSLYWGVSTLFAIGQQIIVNREHLRV